MLDLGYAGGMDLEQTLRCGQSFRWEPCPQRPGAWQGAVAGTLSTVWLENDRLLVENLLPADSVPDLAFWRQYFALDLDYLTLLARYCAGSKRLAECVEAAPGIRVLRQPFFETLCTFLISQNNNIPRITGIVARLCALCGTPLGEWNGQRIFAFPTAQQLATQTPESLAVLRAGWRAGYLLDAAQKVAAGTVREAALRALPTAEARVLLQTIQGVGPKVADCLLLYSLDRREVCPMDVWMKRAIRLRFARGIPRCAKGTEGIAQQYIFAWARENLPRGG